MPEHVGLGDDDVIVYLLGLAVGLIPVVATVARGGTWGVEPTLGALLTLAATYGLGKKYTARDLHRDSPDESRSGQTRREER